MLYLAQRRGTIVVKLAIATPAYGEIFYASYVKSLMRLLGAMQQRRWSTLYDTISFGEIVESRNALLTRWYDRTDATHLLFIDADMGFEPKLVLDMIDLGKPVVGVVAPKRQVDLQKLARFAADGMPSSRAIARAHDFILRWLPPGSDVRPQNGFLPVAGCGAGILLIERSCIASMLQKLPDINDTAARTTSPLAGGLDRLIRAFDVTTVDGVRLSEDMAFCHRWHALCGGEIFASVNHEIEHVGLHKYAARYADTREAAREMPAAAPAVLQQRPPMANPDVGRRVKTDYAAPQAPTEPRRERL